MRISRPSLPALRTRQRPPQHELLSSSSAGRWGSRWLRRRAGSEGRVVPIVYALLALAVLLPLLAPGFILTLDMVFTPELRMPTQIGSTYLFYALLHLLNGVIPSEIIQKTLLFLALFLAGFGMHGFLARLLKAENFSAAAGAIYIASTIYMINPFTYERLMAGQYLVLLGYALLPYVARLAVQLVRKPEFGAALRLGGILTIVGLVSVHTLGLAGVILGAALVVFGWPLRHNRTWLRRVTIWLGSGLGILLLLSGHWIVPYFYGTSKEAEAVSQFSAADAEVFATVGQTTFLQVMHVLRLQGFWTEARDLYLLPQDTLPLWGLVVLLLWALIFIGARSTWRNQRSVAVLGLALLSAGTLFAVGIGLDWLGSWLPFLAGYREPQKFAALVAFAFAIFIAYGLTAVWRFVGARYGPVFSRPVVALSFLLPVLFTPCMWWGAQGQLTPRHYPAGWTQLNAELRADPADFSILFLPWHQYMSFQFAGRIISNPAEKFFAKPIISSNDPELGGIRPTTPNATTAAVQTILEAAPTAANLGTMLRTYNVKYIVLAKEYDYREFSYVARQTDLLLISDTTTLQVYRNTQFKEKE